MVVCLRLLYCLCGIVCVSRKAVPHSRMAVYRTDESVAEIAATDNTTRKNSQNQPNNKSKTPQERLAALDMESTTVQPGMLTMNSLQSNEGIRLWTNLDNACVCVFSFLVALP